MYVSCKFKQTCIKPEINKLTQLTLCTLHSVVWMVTNSCAFYRCCLRFWGEGHTSTLNHTNIIHLQTCWEKLWTLVPVVKRLSAVGNHCWILLWRLRKFNRTSPESQRWSVHRQSAAPHAGGAVPHVSSHMNLQEGSHWISFWICWY